MSENVATSTRDDAQNCVALASKNVHEDLVIFYLFFRQWTGTMCMSREDYAVGLKEGELPPEDMTASYGAKRIIDPKYLRVFDALKKRAETVLADKGLPFCKGIAVPKDKAEEVCDQLKEIAADYNRERDDFAANLESRYSEWISKHPEFAERLVFRRPSAEDVLEKINADFSVVQFSPASAEIDKTNSLNRSIGGLFDEVLHDVSKRASLLLRRSVIGKQPEDLTQRTLSALKVLREKLDSLKFLNGGVRPIWEVVDRLLALMPTKGSFTSEQFNALSATLGLLSDERLLVDVSNGKVTLESYLNLSLPQSPSNSPTLFETQPAPSVHPHSEPQPQTTSIAPAVEACQGEGQSDVSEAEGRKPHLIETVPLEEPLESKTETPAAAEELDLNAMLESFFNEGDGQADPATESTAPETSSSDEVTMPTEDVPPAPQTLHLSAF